MVATTMTISGAVIRKAGAGINSNLSGGLLIGGSTDLCLDKWIVEGESEINATTRYNWTDNYSTLNADVKFILDDAASSLAAMQAISFDMSGYTSRAEAIAMVNILRDRATRSMKLLEDKKVQDFMTGA